MEVFLPETQQKYLFQNYKQSSQYRTYKDFVPLYLHGRPHSTITHCLERRSKSMKYTTDDVRLVDNANGIFTVTGTNGKDHRVLFAAPSCTCRDWITWHLPCKHFFSIFRVYPKWDWNSLPESYRNSAYLSTDQTSITDFFKSSRQDHTTQQFHDEMVHHLSPSHEKSCLPQEHNLSMIPEKKVSRNSDNIHILN